MDPYKILGISPSATDDEVKKAYRTLSRKYHPDANVNNPNKDAAEEMFKKVQQAYDQIMKQRQGGGTHSYTYSNQSDSGEDDELMNVLRAAANYIRAGYYDQARTALHGLDEAKRNGTWYYLAAAVEANRNNLTQAKAYIDRAVALEPNNYQFRELQRRLEMGSENFGFGFDPGMGEGDTMGWYTSRGQNYSRPYETFQTSWCLELALINLCCCCCR